MADSDKYLEVLDAIDVAIKDYATSGCVSELTIDGRTVKYDINGLLSLRTHYNTLYNKSVQSEGIKSFNRNGRIVRTTR